MGIVRIRFEIAAEKMTLPARRQAEIRAPARPVRRDEPGSTTPTFTPSRAFRRPPRSRPRLEAFRLKCRQSDIVGAHEARLYEMRVGAGLVHARLATAFLNPL